ncbi:MAG: methyltransferase domain-containing protein [Alphaproteobacteria bacterium]|nr:methyltransferase domain-containing protein [Alphaproteobacteria bacterium]
MLFDRELLWQNRRRADKNHFLRQEISRRLHENLELLNREFVNVLQLEDEDFSYQANSYDLIFSLLDFHFINDIPQYLLKVKTALQPGGSFIASFFGEENLAELAQVLRQSENEVYGGISPRMPPLIDVKTAAALLQKAGFQNPISDVDRITVEYADTFALLKDLKNLGQGNILHQRSRRFVTKKFLNKILENYRKLYQTNDGKVLASFEIVTICGSK